MTTIGVLLYPDTFTATIAECDLPGIQALGGSPDGRRIDVPPLTGKEIRYLDSILPRALNEDAVLAETGIPVSQQRAYASLYRHFPSFGEYSP